MGEVNESAVVVGEQPHQRGIALPAPQRVGFFESTPKEQVRQATEIANVLSSVIEKQGLFSIISGKKYIKAEGWQTLGTFLGVVPREKSVVRLADGSYEAYVEIVKFRDGTVVGGGSAICSKREKRWGSADEYAVRSMAITRATGKAFRVGFSWIVTLAGYQPTPEEEIPTKEEPETIDAAPPEKKEVIVYGGTESEQTALAQWIGENHPHIPDSKYFEIHDKLKGKPKKAIVQILKEMAQ